MKTKKLMIMLTTLALGLSATVAAMAAPMDDAFKYVDNNKDAILKDWIDLVKIPAKSTFEQKRVEWVKAKMLELGLKDVRTDDMLNVIGLMPAKSADAPTIVLSAHTDTVFPMDTPIDPVIKDGKLLAPGAGDCASNVVGTLYALKAMKAAGITPNVNVIFLASSQEEIGLNGIKYFLNTYKGPVDMVVAVDSGLGSIAYGALGIQWYKVTFKTPAGHALSSVGKPSAAKSLGVAIDRLYKEIPVNADNRTVMNVGTLGGGATTNAIAAEAWMTVDLRSMDGKALESNVSKLKEISEATAKSTGAAVEFEQLTDIPGGILPGATEHKLTKAASQAIEELGIKPTLSPMGSCDSNASIAKGIPSIAIGVGKASGGHSVAEAAEIEPIYTGIKWVISLIDKLN